MSTLTQFMEAARSDRPVYISDVRDAFQREGTRPFHFHVTLYDDSVRRFALKVPRCEGAEESAFVASFLNAMLYNALSSLGAKRIDVYIDGKDAPLAAWAKGLDEAFQVSLPLAERSGYGKCLNVNQRTLATLCGPEARFAFRLSDIADEPEVPEPHPAPTAIPVFAALPERAKRGMLMGMDIGGTDVKLVAALDGRLVAFKEYDWNPAACALAEQLIEPLCLLTRLMRAAVCMEASGMGDRVAAQVFDRAATDGEMASAVTEMEALLGDRLRGFDGIGLCFPDVVIRNRIIGGETPKTYGMRMNTAMDYEAQFGKITNLCDVLKAYATPEGVVMNTNDGPMAAFTTAVEQAAAGTDLSDGFFAHTLGTDLGTGWILPDGSIPEIPLEIYSLIIDLGSFDQRRFPAPDVRSINNVNTGLPGTLQKYTSQSGVFRLAANSLPDAAPKVFQGALDRGLFVKEDERLIVPTSPKDMRKPCLEYFMREAERRDSKCADIFRQIGEYLAVTWRETEYLLRPACKQRTLFGRLVKTPACFDLMCEGARRIVPDIEQAVADEGLANTGLMKQLAAHPVYTVAQFAQAIGAVYYACVGLLQAPSSRS
ncbi:MAG: hypothetical protein IJ119_04765 [Clostridia bacterium]|nr:hypothetical protein [Clostridia bacterium]